jgi:uncharacterized protein
MNADAMNAPLTEAEAAELHTFLASRAEMDLDGVLGLFTAVAIAPSLVQPSAWTASVFGDSKPESFEEMQHVLGLLMRFYNHVLGAIASDRPIAPPEHDAAACARFCKGFVAGFELDTTWHSNGEKAVQVAPFAFLAGRRDLVPAEIAAAMSASPKAAAMARHKLPALVLAARDALRGQSAAGPLPERREDPKVGRNDPCPCGSGKKYKKCCGA